MKISTWTALLYLHRTQFQPHVVEQEMRVLQSPRFGRWEAFSAKVASWFEAQETLLLAVGKATAMVLRNTAWSAQEATKNEAMLK